MCKFFSFITRGDGKGLYFDADLRKTMYDKHMDSHSSIAYHFISDSECFKMQGVLNKVIDKDDMINKYEVDFTFDAKYTKIESFDVEIDQLNIGDDYELAKAWFCVFVKSDEFAAILKQYLRKKIKKLKAERTRQLKREFIKSTSIKNIKKHIPQDLRKYLL